MPRRHSSSPKRYVPEEERTTNAAGTAQQKRRAASLNVLQDIKALRAATGLMIPKSPFARLIREVLMEHMPPLYRMTAESIECIQEATEIYAVQVFEDSNLCCVHRDRVTLDPKDMRLALFLRKQV